VRSKGHNTRTEKEKREKKSNGIQWKCHALITAGFFEMKIGRSEVVYSLLLATKQKGHFKFMQETISGSRQELVCAKINEVFAGN
jgi:hypothetical protein